MRARPWSFEYHLRVGRPLNSVARKVRVGILVVWAESAGSRRGGPYKSFRVDYHGETRLQSIIQMAKKNRYQLINLPAASQVLPTVSMACRLGLAMQPVPLYPHGKAAPPPIQPLDALRAAAAGLTAESRRWEALDAARRAHDGVRESARGRLEARSGAAGRGGQAVVAGAAGAKVARPMRRQGTDDAAVAVAVSERLLLSHAKQVRDTDGVRDIC